MTQYESQYERMIKQPIPSLILTLALPTTISMLVTNIYNMADTYFVSGRDKCYRHLVGIVFWIDGDITSLWLYVWTWSGRKYIQETRGKKSRRSTYICHIFFRYVRAATACAFKASSERKRAFPLKQHRCIPQVLEKRHPQCEPVFCFLYLFFGKNLPKAK